MPNNKMERFTQRAWRVMSLAQQCAERLHHNPIDTQHMLVGLYKEEGGIAGKVLRDLGIEGDRLEALVVELTPTTASVEKSTTDLSTGSKRVLELAVDEARRMGHRFFGTEHLLLALARLSDGVAIDVLKRLGIGPEKIRQQTRRMLQVSPIPPARTRPEAPRLPKAAPNQPDDPLQAPAYEQVQTLLIKLMQMLEDNKISTPHVVELLSTLMPDIKLTPSQQAQLVSQLFDSPRFKRYTARLRLTDAQGMEISEHRLSFTALLAEIDSFLASVLNEPQKPLAFKLGSTSLEIRLERTDDNPNEAVL